MSSTEAELKVDAAATQAEPPTCTQNGVGKLENSTATKDQHTEASETGKQIDKNANEELTINVTDPIDHRDAILLSSNPMTEITSVPANDGAEELLISADIKEIDPIGAGEILQASEKTENGSAVELKTETDSEENKVEPSVISSEGLTTASPMANVIPVQATETKISSTNINALNASEIIISELKQALQKTADERDSYRRKLELTEKKLNGLQASYDELMSAGSGENALKQMVEQLRAKLTQTSLQLDDRTRMVNHQEKQINALNTQVASLKEVEALTRSLLQIRNIEVKHLQTEVDDMETKIAEERLRYTTMINKMDAAVQLNADLKKEYETQLSLFRDLREKYEEKVTLLTEEKKALENAQQNAVQ